MREVWLVRHGVTDPNVERRYPGGKEDAALSAQGARQARALRAVLPGGAPAFTSPALRARETARLAGYPDAQVLPGLREAHFGVMAGRTWQALEMAHGEAPRAWIDGLSDPASTAGPPGGETGLAFHERILRALSAACAAGPSGPVVLFTHGGPVRAVLRVTVGLGAVEVLPGRVTVLRQAGDDWWLVGLNWPGAAGDAVVG